MAKMLETTDDTIIADVYAIQNEDGGATKGGVPRIGCKKIGGVYVPIDQLPGYTPDKWRGTKDIHPIETDADGITKRLELTDDIVAKIEEAKTKPDAERTPTEKKLAKAEIVKDKPPKE